MKFFIDYLNLLMSIICMVINVLVQVVSFRYFPRRGLLKSEYLGFVVGFFSFFLLESYINYSRVQANAGLFAISLTNLIIYLSLSYCYFSFINLGETARRIRLLREIYESKNGLTMDEILKQYNAGEIIEKRLNRLLNNGQIVCKDNKFYIGGPVMLFLARAITLMKVMLLGKSSEFD